MQFHQTAPVNCYGLKLAIYADCSLRKLIYCVIYYNFRHAFVSYWTRIRLWQVFFKSPHFKSTTEL